MKKKFGIYIPVKEDVTKFKVQNKFRVEYDHKSWQGIKERRIMHFDNLKAAEHFFCGTLSLPDVSFMRIIQVTYEYREKGDKSD